MTLKPEAIKEIQNIMLQDYGETFNDEQADRFGISILKLYRLACVAFVQDEEDKMSKKISETNN